MKTLDELNKTHKCCATCKTYKLFDSFHIHRAHKDGLSSYCKECACVKSKRETEVIYSDPEKLSKENERNRNRYIKDVKNPEYVEKRNLKAKLWARNNRDNKESNDRAKENRPLQLKAVELLNTAIRNGYITRASCEVCGDEQSEAHHEDYSKPYNVTFLCKKHHMELHRKYKYE